MSEGLCEFAERDWSILPSDLILKIAELEAQVLRTARLTCSAWRQALDEQGTYWRQCSAELRPTLGPLPKNARCNRLTLTFLGSPISCSALEQSPDLITGFITALKVIRLDSLPPPTILDRSLVLHFTNLLVRTSSIEAMLDESAPRWREAWTSITTTASSSVNAWLGREQGPGIILDGGLRPELKIANPVIKIEKQVNLSRLQCQAKHEHPFKRWGEALKSSSPPTDSPLIYSLPDDMRLVHPKESVYPRLESISLPVRGSSIALMLKHSESPGSSVEKLITNMNPGLKRVTFLGAGGNEGVGWSIGSFLRPEKISFYDLPCTIEEVVYVNAEMPRVHHSCSHLKPWEAVLLCSTSLYCLTHFVRPALRHNQCSSIKKVTCVDLRIPSGLFIEECISPILMVNEEEDGEGGEPFVEKSLWSISVSNRSFLLTAPDGLDVEVVTVTMTRIE